jgi:hypothetical protein
MNDPPAVTRAHALLRHISKLGGRMDEFFVSVTREEGLDLLKWYRAKLAEQQLGEEQINLTLLDRDIRRAERKGDPFPVLENFKLYGLQIRPIQKVH